MSEQESREGQESQQGRAEPESYTSGGVTYVGTARSRYGRLQDAVDEFRQQAEWLTGYLFIVSEHFAQEGAGGTVEITAQAAVSYLDALPGVITDVEDALREVEHLAEELRRVMASEGPDGLSPLRVMSDQPEEKVYSEREAAVRLGISKPSLLRLRRDGRIGFYRVGVRVVYSEGEHLRPFLDGCHQPPRAAEDEQSSPNSAAIPHDEST